MYKIGGKYLSKLIGALCWIALLSCGAEKEQVEDPSITEFNDPVIKGISMALAKEPRNADLYFERAAQWVDRGAYDAAIEDLEKAIELDSTEFRFFHLLSDAYLDYFESGKALDVMVDASGRFPQSIPTLLKLAELQLILKLYDQSFFTIQKALNLDGQNPEVFFMLGMLYREQGEIERAINSFQTAVELDPEIIDAWVILGDLFAEKDLDIAVRYYDNAIRLDPLNPQVYHAKAFYLQNSDRTSEAIALYRKINAMDAQYADAYLNTGILYLELDSLTQALEHFDILVKIEPQNHIGYYYRGITKMFLGNKEGAKSDLEQCLVFNTGFDKALQALAELEDIQ